MRYLTFIEALELHRRVIEQSGGAMSIRDLGLLESAIAQPRITFDSKELHPTLLDKAATLGFSIIMNHPFLDGNKRTGHAAIETFLVLNGMEISAPVDDQERVVLAVAAGEMKREAFAEWLKQHTI